MVSPKPAILVIDQDIPTIELYQRHLGLSFRVITASDLRDVIAQLEAETVRAVVLEPAAFGEEGWQLITTIAELHASHPVPIVVCSTLDERRRGIQLGAAAYLVKPVLPATLLSTLERIVKAAIMPESLRHDTV